MKNVRLIEMMSANLISISQLCDQGFLVKFSKETCEVLNDEQKAIMSGTRLSDNYYHWDKPS